MILDASGKRWEPPSEQIANFSVWGEEMASAWAKSIARDVSARSPLFDPSFGIFGCLLYDESGKVIPPSDSGELIQIKMELKLPS